MNASRVAVVGLGVIGGSVALKLAARGTRVLGYATDADAAAASAAGLHVAPNLAEAVADADLVLVAVPLDAIAPVGELVLRFVTARATLFHVGSLQRPEAIAASPAVAQRLVGTHPLAGSHASGFAGADAELFRGATVLVERRADARQRADAELVWSMAGAGRVEYHDAAEHDARMAWASHLPQLAATALAAALARQAPPDLRIGPGGRDATRLAMSAFDMWRPILARAPGGTVEALRALEGAVGELRAAVEESRWDALGVMWNDGATWRAAREEGR